MGDRGPPLRPLRAITATARDISATNLRRRLDVGGPDNELKQLGNTLDDLFGRLDASLDAQRHFVANAAHELRTPLAGQRTLLQVALADPTATAEALRSTCEEPWNSAPNRSVSSKRSSPWPAEKEASSAGKCSIWPTSPGRPSGTGRRKGAGEASTWT